MIPFISDDDLSAYLGTEVSAADLNVVIALDSACQTVRDAIGRQVNLEEDDVVELRGSGSMVLLLPERPIVTVSEVQPLSEDDPLDPSEYTWEEATGKLLLVDDWPAWPVFSHWERYRVTYSHGWALAEAQVDDEPVIDRVPSSIRLVALRLAAAVYRATVAGASGSVGAVQSETIGSYSYTLSEGQALSIASTALTSDDKASLRAWADLRVA